MQNGFRDFADTHPDRASRARACDDLRFSQTLSRSSGRPSRQTRSSPRRLRIIAHRPGGAFHVCSGLLVRGAEALAPPAPASGGVGGEDKAVCCGSPACFTREPRLQEDIRGHQEAHRLAGGGHEPHGCHGRRARVGGGGGGGMRVWRGSAEVVCCLSTFGVDGTGKKRPQRRRGSWEYGKMERPTDVCVSSSDERGGAMPKMEQLRTLEGGGEEEMRMSVSRTCLCCVKYLMFVFNLIFWLGGCGLFGVGVWLSFTQAEFSSLPLSFPSLSAANLLLVAGGVTMVTGFLGCLGALKEQRCLLMTFFVILLLLVLTEVTLVLVIHVFHNTLDTKAQDELKEAMKTYTSDEGLKKSWDNVQKMFKCCGVTNKTDWYGVLNGTLPSSCCSVGAHQCEDGWSEPTSPPVGVPSPRSSRPHTGAPH
ncbi:unnamed protein product [Gadus morhua 'NCC']